MTEVFLTILWCLFVMGGGIFVYLARMNAQRNVQAMQDIISAIEKYQGKVETIELTLAALKDEQAKMKSDLTVVKGVATLGRK
jgi:hypothetical protein